MGGKAEVAMTTEEEVRRLFRHSKTTESKWNEQRPKATPVDRAIRNAWMAPFLKRRKGRRINCDRPLRRERVIPTGNCSAVAHPGLYAATKVNAATKREPKFSLLKYLELVWRGSRPGSTRGSGPRAWAGPFIASLSQLQNEFGLFGAIGEIGVHDGALTPILANQARVGETVFVSDVFEKPDADSEPISIYDHGVGDMRRFLHRTARYGLAADAIDMRIGPSTGLPLKFEQPLRLLSIDGLQSEASTMSDLAWAACNALDGAVVLLDDWSNRRWSGVRHGAERHNQCGARVLTPFAEVANKLFLTTNHKYAKQYRKALMKDSFWGDRLSATSAKVHNRRMMRIHVSCNQASLAACEKAEAEKLALGWHAMVLHSAGINATTASSSPNAWLRSKPAVAAWNAPDEQRWLKDALLRHAF